MADWNVTANQRWPLCSLAYLKAARFNYLLERVANLPRTYARAPFINGDDIRATLTCFDPADKRQPQMRDPCDLCIEVQRVPKQTHLHVQCSCGMLHCLHAMALFHDLALWPEFAHALITGKDTAPLLSALDSRRVGQLESASLQARLGCWLHAPVPKEPQALRFCVFPRWLDAGWDGEPTGESRPALDVDVYVGTRKRPLRASELDSAPLSPVDRELLEMCLPHRFDGDAGFVARASVASHVLHALEGREVCLGMQRKNPSHHVPLRYESWRLTPRVVKRSVPLAWLPPFKEPTDEDDSTVDALVAEWVTTDGSVISPMTRTMYFGGRHARVILMDRNVVAHVGPGVDSHVVMQLQRQPIVQVDHSVSGAAAWGALWQAWKGRGVALPAPESVDIPVDAHGVIWLAVDGSPLRLEARLVAEYPFGAFDLRPEEPIADLRRDSAREEAAVQSVQCAGFTWDAMGKVWTAEEDAAAEFWLHGVSTLPPLEVRIANGLRGVHVRGKLEARATVRLMDGVLDTSLILDVKGLRADMESVQKALRTKRRFVQLTDGTLAEIQDSVRAFLHEVPQLLQGGGHARLPRHHALMLQAWLHDMESIQVDDAVREWQSRIAEGPPDEPELSGNITVPLRSYQRKGVAWLQWLSRIGAGGILADDMGLGKTLQTLAWLAQLQAMARTQLPSLVVCPTSVMHHWVDEATRSLKNFKVRLWYGASRHEGRGTLPRADVVVTTYGVLRQDAVWLQKQPWRALVLDEAQQLKNADAITTRVVKQLPAEHRVALTGTPLENRLRDVWTIMDVVNPGLLGPRAYFETMVEPAVMREPNGWQSQRVKEVVAPFVLRRTKAQVLTDLPAKMEVDRVVQPTREQRRMYDAVAALARADVAQALRNRGIEMARMTVLAALTRLRQVACDPRLVDPQARPEESAKRGEFLTLVEGVVQQGRRALVFSSFVELLSLWRRDLCDMGIRHEYLDGATDDRAAVVRRFQTGNAPLMVVSLKAGGTGLTLTAADTVILCDPWWNPAVEDQAADRAHRIGQTRVVTVYRLITQGTVEERILHLKAKKRELANAILTDSSSVPLDSSAALDLLSDWEGESPDEGSQTPSADVESASPR